MVLQLPNKETLKTDIKPPVVPPYISIKNVHNANQSFQSNEKKNVCLPNNVKEENILNDEHKMNEPKIFDDSTFTLRLINKIDNISPSTAKYARLSIYGCKVSINIDFILYQ